MQKGPSPQIRSAPKKDRKLDKSGQSGAQVRPVHHSHSTRQVRMISFKCILKDRLGNVLSTSYNRDVPLEPESHPAPIVKVLGSELAKLEFGQKKQIHLTASQAYGFYDSNLVLEVPKNKIPEFKTLKIGDEILAETRLGDFQPFRVIDVKGNLVLLDGNHPLAGQDLIFDVECTEDLWVSKPSKDLDPLIVPNLKSPHITMGSDLLN